MLFEQPQHTDAEKEERARDILKGLRQLLTRNTRIKSTAKKGGVDHKVTWHNNCDALLMYYLSKHEPDERALALQIVAAEHNEWQITLKSRLKWYRMTRTIRRSIRSRLGQNILHWFLENQAIRNVNDANLKQIMAKIICDILTEHEQTSQHT